MNKLYYGDNLEVLRGLPDAFVNLVYLDPPFNSNAGYNVLFRDQSGGGADASIEAFGDTWTWGPASDRLFRGLKPKLPPLVSPVKKAARVETGASHQKGAQGALL